MCVGRRVVCTDIIENRSLRTEPRGGVLLEWATMSVETPDMDELLRLVPTLGYRDDAPAGRHGRYETGDAFGGRHAGIAA